MPSAYLGPEYSDDEIKVALDKAGAAFQLGEDLTGRALVRADDFAGRQHQGVQEALGLIDQARAGNGQLSEEKRQQLRDILNKLEQ
ncbi:MAG: hypothetical protein P8N31_10765 [Planctomycetota bacterium]|nr:hypothetical protein [Planctomycetota bacterium]